MGKINSWDLFDTLVAARDVSVPCGDQNKSACFPIRQNVLKVNPEDVVISDFYDPTKAREILSEVAGLNNTLYVGKQIKKEGDIWKAIGVGHHTGDAPYEVLSARRAGITSTMVRLSPQTHVERELFDAGFTGLASVMREARLRTFHPNHRALELFQLQNNLPFLFLASILLHRKATRENRERILMCSRDAQLWCKVQRVVRNLHGRPKYKVEYFFSSRLLRYFPSAMAIQYADAMISDRTLVVDVCGTGQSLARFMSRISRQVACWILVGYLDDKRGRRVRVPYAIEWSGSTAVEIANLADHSMVVDIRRENGSYQPVYLNPTTFDWSQDTQIRTMHEAIELALSLSEAYNFDRDISVPDDKLYGLLRAALSRIDANIDFLKLRAYASLTDEENVIRSIVRSKAAD